MPFPLLWGRMLRDKMKKNDNNKGVGQPEDNCGEAVAREEKVSELEILKQSLVEQKNVYLSQILRQQADFENYRKRVEKEKGELIKYGRNLLIADMIDIYETVQHAVKMIKNTGNDGGVLAGLEHIEKKVSEILRQNNVVKMNTVGEKFDTLLHEAVGVIEKEGADDGTILEELRPGYKIDDRVLRTAMVKIAKPFAKKAEESEKNKEENNPEKNG